MLGKYQSGQMGQTVNLLAYAFGGSNPSLPTQKKDIFWMSFFIIYKSRVNSTGQWSEPRMSVWILASTSLSFSEAEVTK